MCKLFKAAVSLLLVCLIVVGSSSFAFASYTEDFIGSAMSNVKKLSFIDYVKQEGFSGVFTYPLHIMLYPLAQMFAGLGGALAGMGADGLSIFVQISKGLVEEIK